MEKRDVLGEYEINIFDSALLKYFEYSIVRKNAAERYSHNGNPKEYEEIFKEEKTMLRMK